jgi:hypothetical protein
MNGQLLLVLVLTEWRLRTRRMGSLLAFAAMLGLAWLIIAAPVDDTALLVVKDTQVLNNSAVLALASATLLSPILTLFGFFLLRGRAAEDMRSGLGAVIACAPVSSAVFLFGRTLAGLLYLGVLVLAYLASTLVFHLSHGVGPLELGVYLRAYAFVLLPSLCFTAACATLFDSVSVLMGKAGDVLYFFIWVALLALMASIGSADLAPAPAWLLLDFTGIVTAVSQLSAQLGSTSVQLGLSSFNPKLAPISISELSWSTSQLLARGLALLLTLAPLMLARLCFHRYTPDRVKLSAAAARRSPLAVLNAWLKPLSRLVQPLFWLAAKLPGLSGQVLADTALSLASTPAAIALLLLAVAASAIAPAASLAGPLIAIATCWGVLISELSSRDFQADTELLACSGRGGAGRRYLSQLAASCMLGLMFMGLIALRWVHAGELLASLALLSGILGLSALAALMGVLAKTSRCFLAFFLGWLYIALNARDLAPLDALGFNGAANAASVGFFLGLAAIAGLGGYVWQVRRMR